MDQQEEREIFMEVREEMERRASADGVTEAYIRIGNESVLADPTELKRLVLRGNNSSYDALVSPYDYED